MPCRVTPETTVLSVRRPEFEAPLATSPALYLTNVTIQGNGESHVRGLSVSSRVYAEGAAPTSCDETECLVHVQSSKSVRELQQFSSMRG